jgi:two-component system response regulator MtrA
MSIKKLAIDDDYAMTELLTLLLETHGFEMVTAHSGGEGISMIRTLSPNVVILDLMMPDLDGWQVCTAVRKFSSVPILVLSALDSPGLVTSALDAGADYYLAKPVPCEVLIAYVNKLTHRPEMYDKKGLKLQSAPFLV